MKGDYYQPRPAVVVATNRSGSTFLLNCLDSHPQIGCERGEPLDPRGVWQEMLPEVNRERLMRLLWRRPGYRVAMFKLSYKHVRWVGTEILQRERPRIIHLHRSNVLRMGVSAVINTAAMRGELQHATHTFEAVPPVKVRVEVDRFIKGCRTYLNKVRGMRKQLKRLGLPLLILTYEELVGYEGNETDEIISGTADTICQFLEVDSLPLISYTRRVNPQPLYEIVENWEALVGAVRGMI